MNMEIRDENTIKLVLELLDGELSEDEQRQLLIALKSDEEVSRRVLDLYIDNCVLDVFHASNDPRRFIKKVLLNAGYLDSGVAFTNRVAKEALRRDMLSGSGDIDQKRLEEIKRYARAQLQAFLEEQQEIQRLLAERKRQRSSFDFEGIAKKVPAVLRFTRKAIVAASISFCFLLVAFLGIHHYMANRVVAALGPALDAKWEQNPASAELRTGHMRLLEGYATIKFKKGSEVIIQAPSSFELKSSNKMFLDTGWVTAKVPGAAKGFEIQTASSSVVDYGTEFGLMVGNNNISELHVFQGKISLSSGENADSARSQQTWLEKGQAATIDTAGNVARSSVASRPHFFVRQMPTDEGIVIPGKTLSLADMIGGGNGLGTGILNQGLDPATGLITMVRKNPGSAKGFIPEPTLLFIDGVFVPNGSFGPCIVSSAGTRFDDCPTTNGTCYETIANSAMFMLEGLDKYHPGRLNGRLYNTSGQPSISMHPNAGITFDLDKIRSFVPDVEVVRFKALCGISETLSEYVDAKTNPRLVAMSFWVLLDGKTVFTQKLAAAPAQSASIDIPIDSNSRFLTLATTNTSEISMRWGMFAEPILELAEKFPKK